MTPHYAETLRHWRLWDFYLAYCEGGFRKRAIHTVQMKLERASA